jgi:hypothetical protein
VATDININLLETKYSDGQYNTLPVLNDNKTGFVRTKFMIDDTDYSANGLTSKYRVFKTVSSEQGVNYSDPYTAN